MYAVAFAFQHFLSALLAVKNHYNIRNRNTFVFDLRNGLQKRFSAGNYIFNKKTVLAFRVNAFNHFFGAIIFGFLSFNDEREITFQRHCRSHGKCGVRNPADEVEIIERQHIEQIIRQAF